MRAGDRARALRLRRPAGEGARHARQGACGLAAPCAADRGAMVATRTLRPAALMASAVVLGTLP